MIDKDELRTAAQEAARNDGYRMAEGRAVVYGGDYFVRVDHDLMLALLDQLDGAEAERDKYRREALFWIRGDDKATVGRPATTTINDLYDWIDEEES